MLGLKANFAMGLIELLSEGSRDEAYQTAFGMCKNECDSPQEVSGIVALVRGDFSDIKSIAEPIGLDQGLITGVLACARGKTSLLTEFYIKID